MEFNQILETIGEISKTSLGFFWKSGWAFVLGYAISAMIQAFVPKKELLKRLGEQNVKSVSLATLFGAISSSCSFAALAAARSLFQKGANFISVVAFMFASTNLVIELGILIYIFLGWEYIVAEVIGGLLLIAISSMIIKLTYPGSLIKAAREKVEKSAEMEEDFDWKKRIKSKEGWNLVGRKFVMEWKMAYEDIIIGFTIAGIVAVLVPVSFWETIFLTNNNTLPEFVITLENALVAPFVAASTFIGSMGNIPLATVLNAGGVGFAGIMGFIYSDLMVPPLVNINRKYYGTKVAFYIAGIMYLSIIITALILNAGFSLFEIIPESSRAIKDITQFAIDYTFWFNIFFVIVAGIMIYLKYNSKGGHHHGHSHYDSSLFKRIIVKTSVLFIALGTIFYLFL